MTDKTFQYASNILAVMPSGQPWDERVAVTYALVMTDWHDDTVVLAVTKALQMCEWRPSPAELRKVVLTSLIPDLSPRQMYTTVSQIITRVHPGVRADYAKKAIKDGKLHPAVDKLVESIGGWVTCGSRSEEQNIKLIEEVFPMVLCSDITDEVLRNPPYNQTVEVSRKIFNGPSVQAITS
jgi:hypothetical protein